MWGDPAFYDSTIRTVERILADQQTPVRTFLKIAQGATAVDSHTVKFKLVQPYGNFDRQMTYINMMSKTYHDKVGDQGYEAIRRRFEDALGPEPALFNELHALIVRHGKEVCRPRPRCAACVLARECPGRQGGD